MLYLQVSRFLMKSYKKWMVKKAPLDESVKYIESIDFLMAKKCEVSDPLQWKM